ncbi:phosphate acyltransferase PlsX [Spiroplasma endosymbiont of Labia minor]|uniref:phosphate acyltransferase PlsX n=1 Tax=Spiroplasma endosymbiont of Labia minor TaxID=3066305 RepID=UPI0030D58919
MINIAFDVMGSDNGLVPAINAALEFLNKKKDLKILLVGYEDQISVQLKKYKKIPSDRIEIINASQVIEMNEGILEIRRKKDSSMVKALELVKEKKADAMVTGGSTPAFIAGAHFIIGEINGISRPAFMPTIPTIIDKKIVLLLDVGANAENSPEDLQAFAIMANIYSQQIHGIEKPKIALVNIGEEKSKGLTLQKDTYKLLTEDKNINFIGNVEPRYLTNGEADIFVTDGFSGNLVLKTAEGMARNLMVEIKNSVTKNFFRKLAALSLKKAFKEVANKFDYKNHAGAILLGIDGIVFKSHGSSDIQSFEATLRMTYDAVKNDVVSKLKQQFNKIEQ